MYVHLGAFSPPPPPPHPPPAYEAKKLKVDFHQFLLIGLFKQIAKV